MDVWQTHIHLLEQSCFVDSQLPSPLWNAHGKHRHAECDPIEKSICWPFSDLLLLLVVSAPQTDWLTVSLLVPLLRVGFSDGPQTASPTTGARASKVKTSCTPSLFLQGNAWMLNNATCVQNASADRFCGSAVAWVERELDVYHICLMSERPIPRLEWL